MKALKIVGIIILILLLAVFTGSSSYLAIDPATKIGLVTLRNDACEKYISGVKGAPQYWAKKKLRK